jgi:tripartite-type tricarboxylate transporter receptor subunit TctC
MPNKKEGSRYLIPPGVHEIDLRSMDEKRTEKKGESMKTRISGRVIGVFCFLIAFLSMGLRAAPLQAAGEFPTKTITIVVPMVAGGQFDLGARLIADAMEKQFKQPVVVVNRPGGGGTIGGYSVVSAKPDGYTLGYFYNAPAAPEVFSYFYAAPYTSKDLVPICRVQQLLNVITVRTDAPYNTLKEFVEYARKNPGTKYGHNGKATIVYLMMTTIAKAEKLNLVDVPYDGDGAVFPAILGGHIPLGIPAYSIIKSQINAKKLKILASLTEKRSPLTPDVPSVVELGYKLPYVVSVTLYAPKKTPQAVVKKIEDVMAKIVEDKEFQKKNDDMDMTLAYSRSADFQKELEKFKENVSAFFVEQGLVKN